MRRFPANAGLGAPAVTNLHACHGNHARQLLLLLLAVGVQNALDIIIAVLCFALCHPHLLCAADVGGTITDAPLLPFSCLMYCAGAIRFGIALVAQGLDPSALVHHAPSPLLAVTGATQPPFSFSEPHRPA